MINCNYLVRLTETYCICSVAGKRLVSTNSLFPFVFMLKVFSREHFLYCPFCHTPCFTIVENVKLTILSAALAVAVPPMIVCICVYIYIYICTVYVYIRRDILYGN